MTRLLCLLLSFAIFAAAHPAAAQQNVAVRLGNHGGYTRVVFDWPVLPSYKVAKINDTSVRVDFGAPGKIDSGALLYPQGASVSAVTPGTGSGGNLSVTVTFKKAADVRDFTVGNRIVLDIGGAQNAVQKKEEPLKEPPRQQEAKKEEPAKEKEKPAPAAIPEEKEETAAASAPPEKIIPAGKGDAPRAAAAPAPEVKKEELPQKTVLEQTRERFDAHVITVSGTEAIGLAAFERNGMLWIVTDKPNVNVPPQVAGPTPGIFPPFEKVAFKGGVAYRTKMPGDGVLNVYGEGGGLVWRLVVTPVARDRQPVPMQRQFLRDKHVRGATAFWPMAGAAKIVEFADPAVGDKIKAVTVTQAEFFAGPAAAYVDFAVFQSPVGIAILPKVDDLEVKLANGGVQVTRPDGLALARERDINRRMVRENMEETQVAVPEQAIADSASEFTRIFDFDKWTMGGIPALEQNQHIMLANMTAKDTNGRVQDMLALAKMNIANDRGPEALGFLRLAESELPALADGPEFIALRGVAEGLSGKHESAFDDLFLASLKGYRELDYWRSFTLASLEDWRQAHEILPRELDVLASYPRPLLQKLALSLSEVALRAGDVARGEAILALLQKDRPTLKPWTIAGMDYLKGEAHRQSGELDQAKELWRPLSTGPDDLYRAKAGLALTLLELENADIAYDQAVDRLEGLRYAWRGDELEAQINQRLGKLYVDKGQYMKGFTILRDAAGMSPDSDVGRDTTAYMTRAFADLLMNKQDLSPLDAVTVYEEFRELTPPGDEGNKLIQKLAERLVEADLLDRASGVLQHQVEYRLDGAEKARVALRLGVVYLLDRNAVAAMKQLDLARGLYDTLLTGAEKTARLKEIDLLRARAMSQMNKTEEALALLGKMEQAPDINSLRADIAWQARLWEDAAEAIQDLILDESLDAARPLTQKQADLVLNRAVALNLAGNRVELASMRKRYFDQMKKTARSRLFDVVTRPRQSGMLADRETINALVSEVDLFKDFLEAYKNAEISN